MNVDFAHGFATGTLKATVSTCLRRVPFWLVAFLVGVLSFNHLPASAQTIAVGPLPSAIAVNPETNKIYVANYGSNNVTVIDGATNTTANVTVGTNPSAIAVNPETNKIYVANYSSNSVTVIDGVTNNTTTVAVGSAPWDIAVNIVTNKVYVPNDSGYVIVIDGITNVTTTVEVGSSPRKVAVNPVTNKVYVTNYSSNNVTVIDGVTNNTTTVAVGSNPRKVAVNPVTNKVYVANYSSNSVTVIDAATNSTITVAVGSNPNDVAVNPVTNKVYVANSTVNTVTVIDGVTNNTTSLAVGTAPWDIAINTATNKIHVANSSSLNVTVIDGSTDFVITTVGAGSTPWAIAVNKVTTKIYVANRGSNNVTVISGESPGFYVTGSTTFPATAVGGRSQIQVFGVRNTGSVPLIISTLSLSPAGAFRSSYDGDVRPNAQSPFGWGGNFGSDANGAPTGSSIVTVNPGMSTDFAVFFQPTSIGSNTATLSFTTNMTPSVQTITLTGEGVTGSAPSAAGTPVATAFNGYAVISFEGSEVDGGAKVGYTVVSNPPGGFDSNGGSSSDSGHVVTGLTNGTAYTFTVVANNGVGSATSAASNAVTPTTPALTLPKSVSKANLLAYYPFYGNTNDLMGGFPFSTPGMVTGGSLSLSGEPSGKSPIIDGIGYKSFSVSVDFNMDTEFAGGPVLVLGPNYRSLEFGIDGMLRPRINANNSGYSYLGGPPETVFTGTTLTRGVWYRATVTVDVGTAWPSIKLYINGGLVGTVSTPQLNSGWLFDVFYSYSNLSDRQLLFWNPANGSRFKGLVNNLLIYGRALDDAEASMLNALLGAPGPSLSSPTITSGSPPDGMVGVPYNFPLTATGTPTPGWFSSGSVPPGLSVDGITGVISGTPTTSGSFTFTVSADNGVSPIATQTYTINIAAAMSAPWQADRRLGGGGTAEFGLRDNGQLWSWGVGNGDALGRSNAGVNTPSPIGTLGAQVRSVAAAGWYGVALKTDGSVWAWGWGDNVGAGVGLPAAGTVPLPLQVTGISGAVGISTRYHHTLALKGDGTVWGFGREDFLALGPMIGNKAARQVPGLINVRQVAAGEQHSLALLEDGTVRSWGSNTAGQLGVNTGGAPQSTQQPVPISNVVRITSGSFTSLALKSDGTVWWWGANAGSSSFGTVVPTQVPSLSNVVAIAAGNYNFFALLSDGTVKGWGDNAYGRVGIGFTGGTVITPTLLPGLSNVVHIAGGEFHGVAATASGTVYAWGNNGTKQICGLAGPDVNVPTACAFSLDSGGGTAPAITSSAPPSGTVGVSYNHTATATGSPTPTWSVTAGSLPAGLTLNATSGVISGTPTTAGTSTFTLVASNGNAPDATQAVTLVIAPAPAPVIGLSPTSISFGSQVVATSSMSQTVVVSNTGSANLVFTSLVLGGVDPTHFTSTPTCSTGVPVPPAGSCNLVFVFSPTAVGAKTATFTITSNAAGSPHVVNLGGTGIPVPVPPTIAFVFSPSSILSGGTSVGTLTVTNSNATPLTADPFTFNYLPAFVNAPIPAATSTCAGVTPFAVPGGSNSGTSTSFTIPASGSCTFNVTVTSSTVGVHAGTISAGLISTPAGVSNATPFSLTVTAAPVPCSAGNYSGTGNTPCTAASPGYFVSGTGATSQTACSIGTFSGTTGATSCTAAPAGSFVSTTGATSQTLCAAGNYQPSTGQSTCIQASPGSFVSTTGATSQTACSIGTFSATTGATSCTVAPAGSFVSTTGATSQTLCAAGNYQPSTGQSTCIQASANFYVPAAGATSQIACPMGQTSPPGATVCTAGTPPVITSTAPPNGLQGQPFTYGFIATGTAPITWSIVSGDLPPGLTLNASSGTISGTPTTLGTFAFTVRATNAAGQANFATAMSVEVPIIAVITLSTNTLNFGNQNIGTISAPQVITITNTGNGPFTILSISSIGNFRYTSDCSTTIPLPPRGSCTLNVTFTPVVAGIVTGRINVNNNAEQQGSNGNSISLSGTGIAVPRANISLSTNTLNFGNQNIGTTSAPQVVTITNTGDGPFTILSISSIGDFGYTSDCSTTIPLPPRGSCTLSVTFTPLVAGTVTGRISVNNNAEQQGSNGNNISLSGTGVVVPRANIIINPATTFAFGEQAVGSSSAPQIIFVSNIGQAALELQGFSLIGTSFSIGPPSSADNPDNYPLCAGGNTVAVGASCAIGLTFSPAVTGPLTGRITITHNATPSGAPANSTINFSGTGTARREPLIRVSGTLTFAEQVLGTTSEAKPVTITNIGTADLNVGNLTITPNSPNTLATDFTVNGSCGVLIPNASCNVNLTFTPNAGGSVGLKGATLNIASNAANAGPTSASVALLGTAVPIPVPVLRAIPSVVGFGNVLRTGTSSPVSLTVTNTGVLPLIINSVTISPVDYQQTNSCTASPIAPNSTCIIQLRFSPLGIGLLPGTLTINSNAPTSPDKVPLTGKGCLPPVVSRFFVSSC
ncbi:MAG: choice-of-anchor D domain-containing protein [Rhodocyclaceae bacterium]|nr:choice-of-anchor D domain-containing protein [Rhodocyclaceae bacterium]